MSGKMTKDAYVSMVRDNIEWMDSRLSETDKYCLEYDHIMCILEDSIELHYPRAKKDEKKNLVHK